MAVGKTTDIRKDGRQRERLHLKDMVYNLRQRPSVPSSSSGAEGAKNLWVSTDGSWKRPMARTTSDTTITSCTEASQSHSTPCLVCGRLFKNLKLHWAKSKCKPVATATKSDLNKNPCEHLGQAQNHSTQTGQKFIHSTKPKSLN